VVCKARGICSLGFSIVLWATQSPAGTLGADWTEATPNALWGKRSGHSVVSYGGKMWLFGGNPLCDTWYSSDGTSWTWVRPATRVAYRYGHTSVVHGRKIWLIGGYSERENKAKNDVQHSTDGMNWTTATSHAQWAARCNHASVVHAGAMWVIGGVDTGGNELRDVWYSSDGVNWTSATLSAPWERSLDYYITAVSFQNRLWVICGAPLWWSSDGTSWTQVAGVFFPGGPRAVVCDGKIWVMGGCDDWWGTPYKQVRYSSDGIQWELATSSAPWPARRLHALVVHDNKIWLMGGYYPGYKGVGAYSMNDVWYSVAPPPPTRATSWRFYSNARNACAAAKPALLSALLPYYPALRFLGEQARNPKLEIRN